MSATRVDFRQSIVISVCFDCNNDCTICMLGRLKHRLPVMGFDRFQEVLREIQSAGRYRRLILSGAEVTVCDELPRYVRAAASLGCFETIQIQTNGRRLCDRRYLEQLVRDGVNEFYVSLHGLEAAHDATTRRWGAFAEVLSGLAHLQALGAAVITNTVVTTRNLADLAGLVVLLAGRGVREMQLWNFFPMERRDSRGLVASLPALTALFPALQAAVGETEKPLVLKAFPHCLAPGPPLVFDSWFPATVLPQLFWRQFSESRFGCCPHREQGGCEDRECWGLSQAYLAKYGDEREMLRPRG